MNFFLGILLGVFVGSWFVTSTTQGEVCSGYEKEVQRIETQAKEYQERFNKWCLTQKHRCKI